jgi:hypothetical protein
MEPEGSFLCSQKPATGTYPEETSLAPRKLSRTPYFMKIRQVVKNMGGGDGWRTFFMGVNKENIP